VKALPQLTAPKFPLDGTSYEIDARVKGIVQEGLSVYRVDGEALRALRPDVIITQVQCEVCAVSLADVERATADWTGTRPAIVALNPLRLEDVWDDIRRVARALEADAAAGALLAGLQGRLEIIAARAKTLPEKPRVAALEWVEPLFAGGNWMPQLIGIAGGIPLFGEAGRHSPRPAVGGGRRRRPRPAAGRPLRLRPGAHPGGDDPPAFAP
jgi:iron complex transport system substrate-binding protein